MGRKEEEEDLIKRIKSFETTNHIRRQIKLEILSRSFLSWGKVLSRRQQIFPISPVSPHCHMQWKQFKRERINVHRFAKMIQSWKRKSAENYQFSELLSIKVVKIQFALIWITRKQFSDTRICFEIIFQLFLFNLLT